MSHRPPEPHALVERLAAIYLAARALAVGAFALTLLAGVEASADVSFGGGAVSRDEVPDPTVCQGENLVLSIGRSRPEAMARIDAAAEAIPYGTGLFWRLEKPGVPASYLYGTMHVADERATTLLPEVERRIAGADTVALEIKEIADPVALQAAMSGLAAKALYLDGTTLAGRLSDSDVETLRGALARRGPVPWPAAQRMRPWLLMAAMSLPACERARKEKGRPIVDQLIAAIAERNGRPVVGLETVESQVATIAGLPEPLMLRALADVARLGRRMDDVFETTVALYESGETAKIWALMRDPALAPDVEANAGERERAERMAGYAAFQEHVIDRRNATMVAALEPLLERGNAFAGVGALHLPGAKGMLALLVERGWRVTRVD